jgi:predicted amidohydrolase
MTSEAISEHVFRAALVQMRSGRDVKANVAAASALIREAATKGAHYVQTPENTALMDHDRDRLAAAALNEARHEALASFRSLAAELGIWLHIGSLAVAAGDGRAFNRSYLLAPDGGIAARYDKIHMFDVNLPNGESYRESATFAPGNRAVLAALPWGMLGMSICYDLRFAEQYRALAQAGAQLLAVPSAFTWQTGEAHWHVLLRARAIETGCYVLAAAQGGRHEIGRTTYGHSLIVSPWGDILAQAGTEPGVIHADIDTAQVTAARERIPVLRHARPFQVTSGQESNEEEAA